MILFEFGRRPFLVRLALALVVPLILAQPALKADQVSAGDDVLCVMTYNIRFASPNPPNAWPDRRPILRECIERIDPDLIGTQEGVYYQLRELAADLPRYDWIGLGRDGGSRGEFMAVFYRKERFEPLEYDHFWLSDTPEVIASATWENTNRRMVTWVRFLDNRTGGEFYFINTHFDHRIQLAREKSAELLLRRVEGFRSGVPILLVGDFNVRAGSNPVYDMLVGESAFIDSWETAEKRVNEDLNTFNGFKPGPHTGGSRIDWILYRGPFSVEKTEIVDFSRDDQFPSDHFPVVAWMRLGGILAER